MSVVSAGICGADVNLGPLRVGEVFAGAGNVQFHIRHQRSLSGSAHCLHRKHRLILML